MPPALQQALQLRKGLWWQVAAESGDTDANDLLRHAICESIFDEHMA